MLQAMTRHVKSSFFRHPAASGSVAGAFWLPFAYRPPAGLELPGPFHGVWAALWPIGPIAFVITISIFVAASVIAYPKVMVPAENVTFSTVGVPSKASVSPPVPPLIEIPPPGIAPPLSASMVKLSRSEML